MVSTRLKSSQTGVFPLESTLQLAVLFKLRQNKVFANPHQLLVDGNATGVINSVYMRDQFVPFLASELRKVGGEALVVLGGELSGTESIHPLP